jgi:hypothetical protein
VADVICQDDSVWNEELLRNFFNCSTVEKIVNTPIHLSEDELVWKPRPNGKFTVKSAYLTLLEEEGITSGLFEK